MSKKIILPSPKTKSVKTEVKSTVKLAIKPTVKSIVETKETSLRITKCGMIADLLLERKYKDEEIITKINEKFGEFNKKIITDIRWNLNKKEKFYANKKIKINFDPTNPIIRIKEIK